MRERALWLAVLKQAIDDIRQSRVFRESDQCIRWLNSRDFRFVCLMANVDPAKVQWSFRNVRKRKNYA